MEHQSSSQHKELTGIVSSDRMMKTVTVQVTTSKQHPLYHKRYRWTSKYLSDTGELSPKVGDMVRIISSRPLSKRKRWVVAEVLRAASTTVVSRAVKQPSAAKNSKRAGKKK